MIAGQRIDTFEDLKRIVSIRPGEAVTIIFQRDNQQQSVSATLGVQEISDEFGQKYKIGLLGVLGGERTLEELPAAQILPEATKATFNITRSIVDVLGQIVVGDRSAKEIGGPLRMGHQPGDVPAWGDDPGDRPQRAVRVRLAVVLPGDGPVGVHVAEEHPTPALQRIERGVVAEVAALPVGDRNAQRLSSGRQGVGERRVEALSGDVHVPPEEAQAAVAQQGPGHEPRLGQHLEAVADAEDRSSLGGKPGHRVHDR